MRSRFLTTSSRSAAASGSPSEHSSSTSWEIKTVYFEASSRHQSRVACWRAAINVTMNASREMSDDRGFDVDGFHRSSPDRVRDLIGDFDELALRKSSGGVFGVAFVLEHLQDDFVLAGSRVGVFVAVVRASRHGRDDL